MDHEKLYRTYFMQVYSYLMTRCRNPHLSEELAEETMVRAMTAKGDAGFREDSKILTWLCAIAGNLFADECRKRSRSAELTEEIVSGDDFTKEIADSDLSFRVHVVLHSLEEPYKEVFGLRVFGELSFSAIGALFGKTETWARVTYHRARLKIQERMDHQ